MSTVSFKKAAILSYIAKRKDLSLLQRRILRAAMDGKPLNHSTVLLFGAVTLEQATRTSLLKPAIRSDTGHQMNLLLWSYRGAEKNRDVACGPSRLVERAMEHTQNRRFAIATGGRKVGV